MLFLCAYFLSHDAVTERDSSNFALRLCILNNSLKVAVASSMVLVFLFAVKYGDSITEAYLGLRELGHRRLLLEEQKQIQEDKKSDSQH
jgi:hypothetical protein